MCCSRKLWFSQSNKKSNKTTKNCKLGDSDTSKPGKRNAQDQTSLEKDQKTAVLQKVIAKVPTNSLHEQKIYFYVVKQGRLKQSLNPIFL